MTKFKVKSSNGDLINHEHFCILHALVDRRSFRKICPGGLVNKGDIAHADACDTCPYLSIIDFFDDRIGLFIDDRIQSNLNGKG